MQKFPAPTSPSTWSTPAPHQRQRRHQGKVITSSQQPPRQHVMTICWHHFVSAHYQNRFNMAMENGKSEDEDVYIPYWQWGFSSSPCYYSLTGVQTICLNSIQFITFPIGPWGPCSPTFSLHPGKSQQPPPPPPPRPRRRKPSRSHLTKGTLKAKKKNPKDLSTSPNQTKAATSFPRWSPMAFFPAEPAEWSGRNDLDQPLQ